MTSVKKDKRQSVIKEDILNSKIVEELSRMSVNWQNLRPLNGSQQSAFEELCCQLAAYEKAPLGSKFIRKGAPDAGVECYWKLANGDEWGWQAKFFLAAPGTNQWHQLDESVEKALEKHPRLTNFTICLPIDRQDPRIGQQKWFMDKWNDYVRKWEGWAQKKGAAVEFIYWGLHEIFERLSREDHRGRCFYWFNKELFSNQWFKNHIEEAIANVGPRYSPELNVELPISRLFDGIGRTSHFYERLRVLYGNVIQGYKKASTIIALEVASNKINSIYDTIRPLLLLKDIDKLEMELIDIGLISKCIEEAIEKSREIIRDLEKAAKERKKETKPSSTKGDPTYSDRLDYERYELSQLIRHFQYLTDFIESNEVLLSNTPALLILGHAGTGKTHVFCDVAVSRVEAGLPTLLLLGGQFGDEEPWYQVIRLLGLSCTREELLGSLESAAQAKNARALILIDALNEGEGKRLWDKYILGMLKVLSRYPWLGIALSVRTSYESIVIPEGLVPRDLVREVHHGFGDHEYQATRTFFDYFGIEQPAVPLLVPEFRNPLFLKLFCKGLRNRGLTKLPAGLEGVTEVFKFYIDSVNGKLSGSEYLDFDQKYHAVQRATEKLAETMAASNTRWLPRDGARNVVDSLLPRDGYENSLFKHMISEGVIAEDRFLNAENEWCEGISFGYERFSDHLIVKYLLDKNLDPDDPSKAFTADQPLGSLIKDERSSWYNRGLVEALCVQLPERIRKELHEVAPSCAKYRPVVEAFIESLIWRKPEAITKETLSYINHYVIGYEDSDEQFLEALLTVAPNPEHPYNADFLHQYLMGFELAERDAWWSVFLHYQYGEHGAVARLIDWAWSPEDKSHIDDKSIRLCGKTLAWFLTTSNRFLRDRTTKALVSLLAPRIHLIGKILRDFLEVNDPYVLERLFAVAYGCVLRSNDDSAIGNLSKSIYKWVFEDNTPPPHILLRDYARGVIEVALHRGLNLGIEMEKVRPPYDSQWPNNISTEEHLRTRYYPENVREDRGYIDIWVSVMNDGDFARYIIGTNSGFFNWSSRRLGEQRVPSKKEIYEDFIKNLKKNQKDLWDKLHPQVDIMGILARLKAEVNNSQIKDSEIELSNHKYAEIKKRFERSLKEEQLMIYKQVVIPYEKNPQHDEFQFDLSIAQHWIFQKVLDLGWTPELFGDFDRYMAGASRDARKAERIGKKYQWIAYHDFLAKVSDNFEFLEDSWGDKPGIYQGPWQLSVRDIDPSCLLRNTQREVWKAHTNTWWFTAGYDDWELQIDDVEWIKNTLDLPDGKSFIEVIDPKDNSRWLTLEGFYKYEQPVPPEEDRYKVPRREIWYMLNSYIVKKCDSDDLFEWAKHQDFWGRWMPESHELYRVFLGEFFWAPTFAYHDIPYYHHNGWTRGDFNKIPKEVIVTTDQYLKEGNTFDCSVDDSIHIYLPADVIVKGMQLSWNGIEGHFFDRNGKLIAFDPSVNHVGPGALLIRKDCFLEFLENQEFDILWTLLGEKRILSGSLSRDDWKGNLEISGAYRISGNEIKGSAKMSFRDKTGKREVGIKKETNS